MENRDELSSAADVQASIPGSAAEALKRYEAEKMSRRAVLSKVGLKFGLAAIAVLSVDDLARKAAAALATREQNNKVVKTVVQEFQNAGVAFADYGCSDASGGSEAICWGNCQGFASSCAGGCGSWDVACHLGCQVEYYDCRKGCEKCPNP